MSKSIEENQLSSLSPSSSPQNLTVREKIVHQRLGQTRDTTKANEIGEKDPTKTKAHRQQSEKEVGQKSSMYRGVTKYTETRFEAFVWDNSISGRGKAVYIGVFKKETEAARAHDLVAIKIWGKSTFTNFPVSWYSKEISEMESKSKKEWILFVRRAGKDMAKSNYLGVSRSGRSKKWQARLARGNGVPDLYLGTFDTEGDAAKAYDIAAIRWLGKDAITNFGMCSYDNVYNAKSATIPTEETIGSTSLEKQTVDYVLTQSDPYVLDGLISTGTEVIGVEGNAIEESMFVGTGQESQAPQGLLNQLENVNEPYNENPFDKQFVHQSPSILLQDYQGYSYQNDLSFQDDLTFLDWEYDFGTPVEGSTETLCSALNGESSMRNNMVDENPGVENGLNLPVLEQSYGLNQDVDQNLSDCIPNDFQNPCSEINTGTGIEGGMDESQSDLDISQYLNSTNYLDETDWSDVINELWDPTEVDINSTTNLGFKEDGTQP